MVGGLEEEVPSTFQDDEREDYARSLFALIRPEDEGRDGCDAYLEWNGRMVPFELKSTSKGSVTTVRDFGPDHVAKWRDKHWIIGVYLRGEVDHFLYGNPEMMRPWIDDKWMYVKLDFDLADELGRLVVRETLDKVLGKKDIYTLADARRLQKKQYSVEEYRRRMDCAAGYSPDRMLDILRDRVQYVARRGSTLNNPHIPASYFKGWKQIRSHHAERLRELVNEYFSKYC